MKKETDSSVPLSEFLSTPDRSTESFRVFLLQSGSSPEDLGPAIVQHPDGSSPQCPSNRVALQDLFKAASARLALGRICLVGYSDEKTTAFPVALDPCS
jgi:hypothetical protein